MWKEDSSRDETGGEHQRHLSLVIGYSIFVILMMNEQQQPALSRSSGLLPRQFQVDTSLRLVIFETR